ncbi:putative ATP-dependent RNA helicase DHX35 isoform 1, partial [Danaus plexippus plexippus]
MCRSDLTSALLRLKALGIDNLLKFTFPTPPPAKSLLSSIETLYALQAIDKQGALTPMGVVMSELPLNPMCGRMLCASAEYGCVDEILSVVSMLQVDGVFLKTGGRDAAAARISKRNNFE